MEQKYNDMKSRIIYWLLSLCLICVISACRSGDCGCPMH